MKGVINMAQHLINICTFIIIIVLPVVNYFMLSKIIKILNEMKNL